MSDDFKEPLWPGAVRFPLSGNAPKQLVIYLHGMGGTGESNAWFVEEMGRVMPEAVFYVPDGLEPMDGNEETRQWFEIPKHFKDEWFGIHPSRLKGKTRRKLRRMYFAHRKAVEKVVAYVRDRMAYHDIGAENTFLVGVSQGAMMLIQMMAEGDELADIDENGHLIPVGGVMVIAGCLIEVSEVEAHPTQSKPEFILIHGSKDITVPYSGHKLSDRTLFFQNIPTVCKVIWDKDHTFFERAALPDILRLASIWGNRA